MQVYLHTSQLHINSLHKYEPFVRLEKLDSTGSKIISSRHCPEARFIAVTAYQNDEVFYNIFIYIYIYIYIYIQSTLGKLDFSISRTHLYGFVEFVSSSMLN